MATDPRVRVGHCSPDAPTVDVHVDAEPAFENLSFGDLSDYASLGVDRHEVAIAPAGETDAVLEKHIKLEAETSYTVLATGLLDDLDATVFEDEPGDVPEDKAHVRFIHAAPDAPSVTISVRDGPDIFERISFRKASGFQAVDEGTYDLDVHPAGETDVVMGLDGIELAGGSAYTVVAIGQLSDDSLDTMIVEEEPLTLAADD